MNTIRQWLKKVQYHQLISALKEKTKATKKPQTTKEYFQQARRWSDDLYTATIVSRNRYKAAFLSTSILVAILGLCVVVLVPVQHTELVVVHEGYGGYTWLSTTKASDNVSSSWSRTQSEIANYVVSRESYDPLLYRYQAGEVKLLSSESVLAEYELAQASSNKEAPINRLGGKGYRTVTVNAILPLDSASHNHNGHGGHVNLAQVDYVVVVHWLGTNQTTRTPYSALVSWHYEGIPSDPESQFRDWDGFQVTKFIRQPMNLGMHHL